MTSSLNDKIEELHTAVAEVGKQLATLAKHCRDNPAVLDPPDMAKINAISEEMPALGESLKKLLSAAQEIVTSVHEATLHIDGILRDGLPSNDRETLELLAAFNDALGAVFTLVAGEQ